MHPIKVFTESDYKSVDDNIGTVVKSKAKADAVVNIAKRNTEVVIKAAVLGVVQQAPIKEHEEVKMVGYIVVFDAPVTA